MGKKVCLYQICSFSVHKGRNFATLKSGLLHNCMVEETCFLKLIVLSILITK